ncbi:MAG: hypothetical protein HOP29_14855 [Phycisphaerales bacterium]|nr:hypothetical protein [Phycisphaerales bacterium]
MRNTKPTIAILCLSAIGWPLVALGDAEKHWSGLGLDCGVGNAYWSNGNNWLGGSAPTSGPVVISAGVYCGSGCSACGCAMICYEECEERCAGGPNNGQACTTMEDCDCCDGGSLVATYDYPDAATNHTFSGIEVYASSSNDMTLQKQGGNHFDVTTLLYLGGNATKKVILDVEAENFSPTDVTACGKADIDVAGSITFTVDDDLVTGCSTTETTLTLKGSGYVDIGSSGATRVDATANTVKSTLVLDGSVQLQPRSLEIFGGSGSSYEAKFYHQSTTASIVATTLDVLLMRGRSKIDVDKNVAYVVDTDILVDTSGNNTDAHIEMYYSGGSSQSITAEDLEITAGASHTATLTMDRGALVLTGTATIGFAGAAQTAKLAIDTNGAVPTIANLTLKDRGVLQLQDTTTITQKLTVDGDNAGVAFDQASKTLNANVIVFNKGATFTPALSSGNSKLATN